ncbi:UNVERIFIED_CONTAM: PsbP domain-containing protein 4, chloroplastic [Sesamum calycinum]|uniref:PsbP domain-containing protein 4, chloroplastic n=1 Tax=Sesamum calycinum TaxID=2727403 RepID=A0AAW2QN30_9LAMI
MGIQIGSISLRSAHFGSLSPPISMRKWAQVEILIQEFEVFISWRWIGSGETRSSGRENSGLSEPDEQGWRTYRRPDEKSGGHGVGWSPIIPYLFSVPQDWEEVPVSIADLGGTEIDLRFASPKEGRIFVIVAPVLRFADNLGDNATIEQIGTPEKVINAFGPEVIGENVEGKVLSAEVAEHSGRKYYQFELEPPHVLITATAAGNRLYLFSVTGMSSMEEALQGFEKDSRLFSGRLIPKPITFKRIIAKRSTEQFSGIPYVMTLLNCLLAAWYGLPFITTNNYLVSAVNGVAVVLVSLFASHKEKQRKLICGFASTIFSIIMYASPLSVMRVVIKTKSVEYMPFLLSLFVFLCGCCWLVYGLIGKDIFLVVPNGFGTVLGTMQLILYSIYRKNEGEAKKPSTDGSLEMGLSNHYQLQKQSNCS